KNRGVRTGAVIGCLDAVSLQGLVYQPVADTRRSLELLRGTRRNGTADSRTTGGLCLAQDSHSRLRRQRSLPGDSPLGLQFGDGISTNLSARRMAKAHADQTAAPIVLAARRTDSSAKSPYLALARSARHPEMGDAYSEPS